MKKIDNKTWEKFSTFEAALTEIKGEVEKIIEEANAQLVTLAERANAHREEVLSILDDAATDTESYYNDRSEKWQESAAGQDYARWKDELAEARDQLVSDFRFVIDDPEFVDTLDNAIVVLDGGFRQNPEE